MGAFWTTHDESLPVQQSEASLHEPAQATPNTIALKCSTTATLKPIFANTLLLASSSNATQLDNDFHYKRRQQLFLHIRTKPATTTTANSSTINGKTAANGKHKPFNPFARGNKGWKQGDECQVQLQSQFAHYCGCHQPVNRETKRSPSSPERHVLSTKNTEIK